MPNKNKNLQGCGFGTGELDNATEWSQNVVKQAVPSGGASTAEAHLSAAVSSDGRLPGEAPDGDVVVYLSLGQQWLLPVSDADCVDRRWHFALCHNTQETWHVIEKTNAAVGLIEVAGALDDTHYDRAAELLAQSHGVRWIVLVDRENLKSPAWRQLIASWCYDFHTLPIDRPRLQVTIGRAMGMASLADASAPSDAQGAEYHMVGSSDVMRSVYSAVRQCARSEAPVLVLGETGTGKELVAQAIHERSSRAGGPFVPVNCGAVPPELIQSELFGYEKGAFTGAVRTKKGRIEAASGGTLFLDEIGDLPLNLQVHLLRFLQDGLLQPVGSLEPRPVDVRVVAATNVDLATAVAEGRFREDLYYRLNVLHIDLPPLRERGGDIELLAEFFLQRFAAEAQHKIHGFSNAARRAMREYPWPGNVRELINRVRRALVLCPGAVVQVADLGLADESPEAILRLDDARRTAECDMIHRALRASGHNVSGAARKLGISRSQLYDLMGQHGIRITRRAPEADSDEKERIERLLTTMEGNVASVARELNMSRAALYRRMHKLGIRPSRAKS